MTNTYDTILSLCKQRGITPSAMCREIGIAKSLMTELKMGRSKQLSVPNAEKVAAYFGISLDTLLGKEPVQRREPTDQEIKFALFHGDEDIADEAYEEVKAFAEFVRHKYKKGK